MLAPRVVRERRSGLLLLLLASVAVWSRWSSPPPPPQEPGPRGVAANVSDEPGRLVDRRDFAFVLDSSRCRSHRDLFLAVFVHSAPAHFGRRRAIRETWGNASALAAATARAMALVFLVGQAAGLEGALRAESAAHGDLVMGNFVDSYHNLTYKHVMGLKWVASRCGQARYVLKTDDDVFMDLFQVSAQLEPRAPARLLMCGLIRRPYVKRSQRSKWRVSFREYRPHRYPPYCSGWAIFMSPDVVRELYRASADVPYFWVDDVLVTGILAQRLGIEHVDLGPRLARDARDARAWLRDGGPPLLGHPDLDTELVYRLWQRTRQNVDAKQNKA
ncbi:beta-1,3-galactosyltransferase 5-like isoform X2 [Dermacentor albipictus]